MTKPITTDPIGTAKLNLEPAQHKYFQQCLEEGKRFFVLRRRSEGRCIQASGYTKKDVARTLRGWPGSVLIEVREGKVYWPA